MWGLSDRFRRLDVERNERQAPVKALRRCLLLFSRFPPRVKAGMVMCIDLGLCVIAVLLAYSLRLDEWRVFTLPTLTFVATTCVLWLAIAPAQGVYRSMLRFSGTHSVKDLARSCGILALALAVLLFGFGFPAKMPRTLSVLVPLVLFIFVTSSRLMLSALLREALYSRHRAGRRKVLIYGAGFAGRELSQSINEDPEFKVAGFVDDNVMLRGRRLEGHKIWTSADLAQVLASESIDEVLLAMPTASRTRRREIVEQVRELAPSVGVRSLPNLAEIAAGKVSVGDLREIQVEELLGRDQVAPDPRLMSAKVRGKSVMVTGAGGSIGGELCRQILLERPARIILAERSELALYLIEGELRETCKNHKLKVQIEPRLVDVADRADIARVVEECRPTTVFHAAAYKHVPLVETDPIAGIRNNILGTYNCCLVAEEFGVESFTLVSTDKAVRPSSVMGASKRVCELVVLDRAAKSGSPSYSAVRFGNVLGSSGSVVPLFRRQIAAGGPVTITHRDATRYFMTVSEAAQLVVQAGSMAKGGEIFLLDMGEPVRIHDLARLMVQLSGLAVAADDGGEGDIDIVEIGLRPGEKLHEELLIDNRGLPTAHPRIVKASESGFAPASFEPLFAQLLQCIETRDAGLCLALVNELVTAANSASPGRDVEAAAWKATPPVSSTVRRAPAITARRALES
jgi:FlaA1/EpsC-like NDP-sugar epimerase